MPSCVFRKCNTYTGPAVKCKEDVSFHLFPKDGLMKEKWVQVVRTQRREDDWMPTSYSTICSQHFLESDKYVTKKNVRKLIQTAVPVIKLESSPHQDSAEVCLTPAPSTSTSSTVAADRGSQNRRETVQDQATANKDATQHDVQMTMKVVQANEQRFLEIEPPKTRDRATREEGTMRLAYIQQEEKIPQVCPKCYSELPDCFLATQTQHKQVRSIIAKVYHFLEREYEQLKSLHPETDWSPLSRVRQRAAVATGVSEPDVRDILSEEADARAADEDPPRKRPRTDHQSEYDDVNEAEQIEEALHEPDVYVDTKPALEPNPLEDSEDETIIIKEEQDDNITYYTVMEAVSAPEETEDQSSVCIPKPEPPDVPHSLDINYSVNSSAVEVCSDDIVRRDKQTTISQPAPHVHTQDSILLQVKQEDITIEEEGVS